jgi:hypothetical protein
MQVAIKKVRIRFLLDFTLFPSMIEVGRQNSKIGFSLIFCLGMSSYPSKKQFVLRFSNKSYQEYCEKNSSG